MEYLDLASTREIIKLLLKEIQKLFLDLAEEIKIHFMIQELNSILVQDSTIKEIILEKREGCKLLVLEDQILLLK